MLLAKTPASADSEMGMTLGARQLIASLTVGRTVLLTRRSDFAALRRGVSFLTCAEIEGYFKLWTPAGPPSELSIITF